MLRLIVTLAAILLFSACAEDHSEAAKAALKGQLRSSYKVEFGELKNYPGAVVCGDYNAIGRFNIAEGFKTFIFRNGKADLAPSEDDLLIFCSADPAAQYQKRFATIPPGQEGSTLLAIRNDLHAMDIALQAYRTDNVLYPLTNQGLEALRTASDEYPQPVKFKEGGYIDAIPQDPWDRAYLYTAEDVLRLEPRFYSITTLGRDGASGGTGEDADISIKQLKYLNHLGQL